MKATITATMYLQEIDKYIYIYIVVIMNAYSVKA